MTGLITMTTKELKRVEILSLVQDKRLTQVKASERLGISTRHFRRIFNDYLEDGPKALANKRRGMPSGRAMDKNLENKAIELIADNYNDFGPTLAAEKLLELHDINISIEKLRQLMIKAGLWQTRKNKLVKSYQPRYRRERYGELIQVDGSDHDWFEERAPRCTLLVYIDDATSKLMHLKFVTCESTFSYSEATKEYLLKHGRPTSFYSDKHSVFRPNNKHEKLSGDGITQFGRALDELNISLICANTSQAKGRVERANKTLQGRLPKELRLKKISNINEANKFLEEYIHIYNKRFGKEPFSKINAHQPLNKSVDQLEKIFCWQEQRTLTKNLTIQYDKIMYLIEDTVENRALRSKKVSVYDFYDGHIEIYHENRKLKFEVFYDKLGSITQGIVSDNKRLGNILEFVKNKAEEINKGNSRSKSCPSRTHLN